MLSIIAIFGVVGGVLAFKLKSYTTYYCIRPNNSGSNCLTYTHGEMRPGNEVKYITTTNSLGCPQHTGCTLLGARFPES